MLKILLALAFLVFQESPVEITSPRAAETVRGQANITGNMNVENFAYAELAFAYASDPTSTWFTIQTFSTPILDSALAVWDTTTLTDDDYTLRLRVYLLDGSFHESLVTGLKIRNDTPLPTDTPTLTLPESLPSLPASTSMPATVLPIYPTPTSLPVNPAELTIPSVYSNFTRGTAVTLAVLLLVGIILRLRRS